MEMTTPPAPGALPVAALRRRCDSERFTFATTAELEPLAAALAEGHVPTLLIPPGGRPHAEHHIVREPDLTKAVLRALIAAGRPVLILPRDE